MQLASRILICVLVFLVSGYIANLLFTEIAVYYEMWTTGASSRQDLGDDFGLELLLVIVVTPASWIAGILASILVWRRLSLSQE
jgi:hypothetical protein